MDGDQRAKREDDDRAGPLTSSSTYAGKGHANHPGNNGVDAAGPNGTNGYTLMVAGQRTGKTSFLRLLLDTCDISNTATKEQLASVAKFVQGCSGHTSHVRTVSIDIDLDLQNTGAPQHLTLSLVDTPSFDPQDEPSSERLVSEMLRLIDSRFAEGVEDVSLLRDLLFRNLSTHS
jgi:hypothetical protein